MKSYYLRSFGCQMNEHDAERICALLEAQGLSRVEAPDDADVLVYNTCTVRESAAERLAGHLGTAARLKRVDARRLVLITGCLPQAEQAALFGRFPFVDGALGPQNLYRLRELLPAVAERTAPLRPAALRARPGTSGRSPHERRAPGRRARPIKPGADRERVHQLLFEPHRAARARAGA